MISAYAGQQQYANVALQQNSVDGVGQQKTAPPGARNVLGALQAHGDGARQAFDKAASQILTSFLDSMQNRISDEPVKGGNDVTGLTQLTSAEFESTLSVSAFKSDGRGNSAGLDLESYAGLSFDMEKVDGKLTSFNLDFDMSTAFTFEGSNAAGGYQNISYSNTQSFSISFTLGEDENGNEISTLSFERSEVTQASYMSYGDQTGLGFGGGVDSLNDMAATFDGGPGGPGGRPPPPGGGSMSGEADVNFDMDAALEILKSITDDIYDDSSDDSDNVFDSLPSLFADSYYEDY